MPSLSLYVDVQARQFVRGFTNPLPATIPDVYLLDSLNLTIYFLHATGVPSAPYSYLNYSTSTVKALLGVVAGIPQTGSFTLSDGASTSTPIPFNAIGPIQVQQALEYLTQWTTPIVAGTISGPYRITNSVNGVLSALTGNPSELLPTSQIIISRLAPGSSTTPAVNLVRLALAPFANQATWTIGGSPSYSFSGEVTPDPNTIQQFLGQYLSMEIYLQIQVTTGSDVETLALTQFKMLNELL